MADIYVGRLKQEVSKKGNVFYRGWFGKIPIIAFTSKKEDGTINIKLDVGRAKWISEQEDNTGNTDGHSVPETDDMPF